MALCTREYLWIDIYMDWCKDRWIHLKLDVLVYNEIDRYKDSWLNGFMYQRIFMDRYIYGLM